MVFVHARNETVRTAMTLSEIARNQGDTQIFMPPNSSVLGEARKAFSKSRNKQLREMFPDGFGMLLILSYSKNHHTCESLHDA
jgi:activating signal cointegrator complex subunit 3